MFANRHHSDEHSDDYEQAMIDFDTAVAEELAAIHTQMESMAWALDQAESLAMIMKKRGLPIAKLARKAIISYEKFKKNWNIGGI